MFVNFSFSGYDQYYRNSFAKDLERLKGKPIKGEFPSREQELYYAISYTAQFAIQNFLDLEKKAPLDPMDLGVYGEDAEVVMGIADPYLSRVFRNTLSANAARLFPIKNKKDLFSIRRKDFHLGDFLNYLSNDFSKDLERKRGKEFPENYENSVDQLYYVAAHTAIYLLQQSLPVMYGEPLEELKLPKFEEKDCAALQMALKDLGHHVTSLFRDKAKEWIHSDRDELEEMGMTYVFFANKGDMRKSVFEQICNQFADEFALTNEMQEFESAVESDPNLNLRYNGPQPKGYYYGIEDLVLIPGEDDLNDDVLRVTLCMPNEIDAARLFCKILQNAGVEEHLTFEGNTQSFASTYTLTYDPEGSSFKIRNFYDNMNSLNEIIWELNKKPGIQISDCYGNDGMEIPEDDPETIEYFRSGDLDGFYILSPDGILSEMRYNPPETYEDMLRLWATNFDPERDFESMAQFARASCSYAYKLAYLIVHYGVKIDTDEREYDL